MKGKWKKHGLIIASALLVGALAGLSALSVSSGIDAPSFKQVYADDLEPYTVAFEQTETVGDSNDFIKVNINARGNAGDKIVVNYRTYNGNAIKGVDYQEVSNSVTLTVGEKGYVSYPISVKCLNDSNTREKLRLSVADISQKNSPITKAGRHFYLEIVSASSEDHTYSIDANKKTCKCFLPYGYAVNASMTANTSVIGDKTVAYLNDYKNMESRFHSGDNDISGKEHWKTWKEGVNFDCDTTRRWTNAFINNGFANAYGTYLIKNIDDDKVHSTSNIYMSSGNRQWMNNYSKSSSDPGLSLYYEIEPCTSGGHLINGRAMNLIAKNKNPRGDDKDLVDMVSFHLAKDYKQISWIQESNAWYSSKNTLYTSTFYKTAPYNGILDYGLAIFNNNRSWDREVHDIWMMLALVDDKAPEIVSEYCQMNPNGGMDIYIRFSEPVYAAKKSDIEVRFNGKQTPYDAKFVEASNFSDTLVYNIPAETVLNSLKDQIKSLTYQFYKDDIFDMSYSVDNFKNILNNPLVVVQKNPDTGKVDLPISFGANTIIEGGVIDLIRPDISVTTVIPNPPTTPTSSVFEVSVNANPSDDKVFENGNVYYTWSKSDVLPGDKNDPASYDNVHVMTPEERGSFNLTLMKNESLGIDSGSYYLHVLAVSSLGFKSTYTTPELKPYKLDGEPPEITNVPPTGDNNKLSYKKYCLKVVNKGESGTETDIDYLNMVVTYLDSKGETQVARFKMIEEGKITDKNFVKTDPGDNYVNYCYVSDITGAEATEDAFMLGLMGERERLDVQVHFEIGDTAGNRSTSSAISTVYDLRPGFKVNITKGEHYEVKEDAGVTLKGPVYDITAADGEGLLYELAEDGDKTLITRGARFSVTVSQYNTESGKAVERVFEAGPGSYQVTLTDLGPGYYEARGNIKGTLDDETTVNKVSTTNCFYLTKGFSENTTNKANANGNVVLTNRVYQLNDASFYYFNKKDSSVGSYLYGAAYNSDNGRYEGGSYTPTFSSIVEAKNYIKFMEYRDLELIQIDSNTANLLNTGSGTIYTKAAGETKNAAAGQYWIRYKKANWTPTAGPSGWAYYFYGESNIEERIVINGVGGLSQNLVNSITAVTNRIVNDGAVLYLVGEDYTDSRTQAPYLSPSQIHVDSEIIAATMSGNTFATNPTYAGDKALYGNNLVQLESGNEAPKYLLATNLPLVINESTSLYFKDAYSLEGEWTLLNVKDGTLLKDALGKQTSGVYAIREYGPAGVGEFSVYIDKSLPKLPVVATIEGADASLVLDGRALESGYQQVVLGALTEDPEAATPYLIDDGSYVALYTYPGRKLINVFYGQEMKGYVLADNNYLLVVGDRSGNVANYIVRTGNSVIDASISENEARTIVYVRVNNRDESEIYLYEVYLNETLIDNVFAPIKTYRDAGIYRVEIRDIYGNTPKVSPLTFEHAAPTPDITWYYRNDNDGYSVYNPDKPGRMILKEDTSSPRTTNIYASSMVRLLFNGVADGTSNVEFEMLDIDSSSYTYNAVTGSLSVNSLASWKLRVWYANQPENDRTYIFSVDNKAPEIMATFAGEIPSAYVEYDKPESAEDRKVITTSSFDTLDFTKYKEGDVATLDTLAYEKKEGLTSVNIADGAIIHGSRILVNFSDASGIRPNSVTVTRNGQPIKIETENIEEDGLALNGYGIYVITAIDNLGNTATFTFNNLEGDIANGFIDGQALAKDTLRYGSESIQVVTLFEGVTTVLVKVNGVAYTYEFHNDDGLVTYGQYYIFKDESKSGSPEEELPPEEYLYAEYVANSKFSLDRRSDIVRRNAWYDAVSQKIFIEDPETGKKIEKWEFKIEVMFDDNGNLNYRVIPMDYEIEVEISFSASALHLPARYQATLSKEIPSITIKSGDKKVEVNVSLEYIYVSDTITIEKSVPTNIEKIEYAYNKDRAEFGKTTVIFDKGAWLPGMDLVGEENGFYQITVTNKYNSQTIYTLNKIDAFESIVTIQCQDGSRVTFRKNEGTIHSNYSVEIKVMTTEARFEVINDGKKTVRYGQADDTSTTLVLKDAGISNVTVICGKNNISEDFVFNIQPDQTFVFTESWITGYNEKALRRDEGYTSNPCTIVVDDNDIAYVDMVYNGDKENPIRLYDNVTDEKLIDPELLKDAIGRYGVGEYVVGFRNVYGDLVKKTVYFNNVPSLVLTRTITSDPTSYQVYDMELAIRKGFYSNNLLRFSTPSTRYIFTINGTEYKLDEPKELEITNSSGSSSVPFNYAITYLDEYGNYVEFNAILYRNEVPFDASGITLINVNGVDYTKDDVYITFDEELKATVSVNGGAEADYISGTMRYADGEYRFVVRDIAGNKSTFVVNHKSMNHYSLSIPSTGEEIIPGSVINNNTVTFYSNDGSSKIKYVVRNGELVSDYASNNFLVTGHYQVLIEDNIGNQAYEEFTILNNSLATFSYEPPYEYEVTEIWRTKEDGTKELVPHQGAGIKNLNVNGDYLVVVTSTKTASSFNFFITINNDAPTASLVGVEDGQVTARDVSLTGLKNGDVVKIYKDGELVSTTTISLSNQSPTISTGGRYHISVTNLQGVTKEFDFTRKAVANVAGSIFFIVASVLVVIGVGIGLVFHTKLKTDD